MLHWLTDIKNYMYGCENEDEGMPESKTQG